MAARHLWIRFSIIVSSKKVFAGDFLCIIALKFKELLSSAAKNRLIFLFPMFGIVRCILSFVESRTMLLDPSVALRFNNFLCKLLSVSGSSVSWCPLDVAMSFLFKSSELLDLNLQSRSWASSSEIKWILKNHVTLSVLLKIIYQNLSLSNQQVADDLGFQYDSQSLLQLVERHELASLSCSMRHLGKRLDPKCKISKLLQYSIPRYIKNEIEYLHYSQ